MQTVDELIAELNQNYNDLGEDLLFLESVVYSLRREHPFPEEILQTAVRRLEDCIRQHTEDIRLLSKRAVKEEVFLMLLNPPR